MVFVGAFLEESTEYAVGDRYSRRAQEGAEPGDSEATADESTTVLLMIISEFTITINGHSDATNVVLTNELTANGGLVSVSGSQESCTIVDGLVVCDLAKGESVTLTIVLAQVTGGQISSKVDATSYQSVTSSLDPWECFLDLSGPDSDLTPTSALLESVVGSSNNLLSQVCHFVWR